MNISVKGTKNTLIGTDKNIATYAEKLMNDEEIYYNDRLSANNTIRSLYKLTEKFGLANKILIELV